MKVKQLAQIFQNLAYPLPQHSQPGTAPSLVVRTGVRAGVGVSGVSNLLNNYEESVIHLAEAVTPGIIDGTPESR